MKLAMKSPSLAEARLPYDCIERERVRLHTASSAQLGRESATKDLGLVCHHCHSYHFPHSSYLVPVITEDVVQY